MSSSIVCELVNNTSINNEFFILQFVWEHKAPKAGQFFMLKPLRTSVFLPRPIGIFEYNEKTKIVKFLIAKKGRGTHELSQLYIGEKVQLTGPAGNCWSEFFYGSHSDTQKNGVLLPENGCIALVGGSAGVAPLSALVAEKHDCQFHFYAGFRQGFRGKEEEEAILGAGSKARKIIITAEDGRNAIIGKIVDFLFEPESYDLILGCGPQAMLIALKKKCESKRVPFFFSLESRLACGVGACLGCTIKSIHGNRRCCKDGPIFNSREIIFNE